MNTFKKDIVGVLKFSIFPFAYLILAVTLFIGSDLFLYAFSIFMLLVVVGEIIPIKDDQGFDYGHDNLFLTQLCLSSVILVSYLVVFLWFCIAPQGDFLGLGQLAHQWLGIDVLAQRQQATGLTVFAASYSAFLASAALGIVVSHELIHKPVGSFSYRVGVIGQIVTFMSYFSIVHPRGHHRLVCTAADPATPRRGESVYTFMLRSMIGQHQQTWALEKRRLAHKQLPAMHWSNQALQMWLLEAVLAFSVIAVGGLYGALAIALIALSSNILMELINFTHHYGLLRDSESPVAERHTWDNTYKVLTFLGWAGNRHAYHHGNADAPYWHYGAARKSGPVTIAGFLTSAFVTLVPPLHRHFITPRLIAWDWEFATPAEQRLAVDASRASGQVELVAHANELEKALAEPAGKLVVA